MKAKMGCKWHPKGKMDTTKGGFKMVSFFALNGAFCGWPGRGERLLRAKLFFFGEGREPEIKFNRGLSTAARCCPRLLHLKETWQPRYRQPQAGVSA